MFKKKIVNVQTPLSQRRSLKRPLKLPPGLAEGNNSRLFENMKVLKCLHICEHQMSRFQTHVCVFLNKKKRKKKALPHMESLYSTSFSATYNRYRYSDSAGKK